MGIWLTSGTQPASRNKLFQERLALRPASDFCSTPEDCKIWQKCPQLSLAFLVLVMKFKGWFGDNLL